MTTGTVPEVPAVHVGPARPVVPGPGLPAGLRVGRSNNNLDATWHDGRLFLAWRTAPSHFASADAALHVVVSDDGGRTWAHDRTVTAGRDVREPRLVAWRGRLLLYWFTAGTSGTRFEPDRIWVSERGAGGDGPGSWSAPVAVSPPDCVVWRVRPVALAGGDRLVMSLYRNACSLFTARPVPLDVELWASDDGVAWAPLDPDRPVVHAGGSETEILPLDDGRLLAVVRKEGPEGGWGSDVAVSAPPAAGVGAPTPAELTEWALRGDLRKTDSPLLFADRGRPFLVTRRQVAFGGRYDVVGALPGGPWLPDGARTRLDQLAYWLTPKRTALYAVDPDALALTWCADLPSAGDTAFAAEVPASPDDGARTGGAHVVFNYSSPTGRGWWPWLAGQLNPTHVYALDLTIDA